MDPPCTFQNIPEGALKPSSCLQQLTATNRQKDGSGGKQGQQRTKESNAVVIYLEKESLLIVMAMLNI